MITAYAEKVNFNELMERLSHEVHVYHKLPAINRIKKEGEYQFRILISTVLSSRTKDKVTAQASGKLFSKAPDLQKLSRLPETEIRKLIYPVGFYRIKARNIKNIAKIILKKYNGLVPDNMDDLIKLPGVGRKTANLVLGIAFDIDSITVDTHVHRISNRLGIIKTTKPCETEQDLQIILPREHWISLNTYLVIHGQSICKPISPLCSRCKIISFCQRVGVDISR